MTTIIARFALLFVIAGLIILAVTRLLFSPAPPVIIVQLFAVALSVWARVSFPTGTFRVDATPAAATVVRRGPYRLIRHPMYSAVLLLFWSAVLSHLGLWTLILAFIITMIVTLRIVLEERILKEQYADYVTYAKDTKAVIPFLL